MSQESSTEPQPILSSPAIDSSVELKKRKSTQTSVSQEFDKLQFQHLSDQILAPIEDEEIIEKASYTWTISNFKELKESKVHSPTFKAGGYDWSILLFPRGNANNFMALYLEPIPPSHLNVETDQEEPDDPDWYVCAQFTLIISNPKDPNSYIINTSQQRFNKDATDWGFSNFADIRSLYHATKDAQGHPRGALVHENSINITAYVKVLKDTTGVLWHNFVNYDSKKETGFVGFKNQGATCYLNSLLQSYFFTKSFRKAVYQIPTQGESHGESVALALQRVFFQLQHSKEAIDTLELTKSFGWDTADAFTQHDVQEMNRILMDRLESKMKGTPVENSLNKTFVGKMKSYIKCINVDYESSRTEDFWDIQLNVKNLKNLDQAFQNYIEVEVMDGENQYAAQDYGLQDAKKGVVFESFPSVLHLQLKRFEYDFNYDTLVKINDKFEFPDSIDLSPYLDKESNKESPCIYDLHGVLVHAGDISTGHYYAMIKPDKDNKWYRFDDDKVWRATEKEVFDENFGIDALDNSQLSKMTRNQYQNYQIRRHTSAYMLVYIKRSEVDHILQDVTDDDVPAYIADDVKRELEEAEKKRKEQEEMYLYLNINFYTNELFRRYQGCDLGADERTSNPLLYSKDHDYPKSLKVLRESPFKEVLPQISELLGIDATKVNFWSMSYRRNQTLRPSVLIKDIDELTVGEVYNKYLSKRYSFANLWVEQPELELHNAIGNAAESAPEEEIGETKLLLFLKYFDPNTQTLKGETHFYVNEDDTIASVLPLFSEYLKLDTPGKIYEEIQPNSIESLAPSNSFLKSELSNGDIVVVEKQLQNLEDTPSYSFYENAPEFYNYLRTRVLMKVEPLSQPSGDDEFVLVEKDSEDLDLIKGDEDKKSFDLIISSQSPYEELAKVIGDKINTDPKFLRIFINYNGNRMALRTDMIVSNVLPKQSLIYTPFFEYEILNIPLHELENMKSIKVHWLTSSYIHFQVYEFLIPKDGTVQDLINKIQIKQNLSDDEKNSLLLWANLHSKFYQVLIPELSVSSLESSFHIFARILPEEVEALKQQFQIDDEQIGADEEFIEVDEMGNRKNYEKVIPVLQFNKDPKRLHGISFAFALIPNEKLADTKQRLHQRFGLGQKEFNKIRLCIWDTVNAPVYLEDDELITYDAVGSSFLCLDHPNRLSRQSAGQGGGISIKN